MSAPLTRELSIEYNGTEDVPVAASGAITHLEAWRRWRAAPALKATAALHLGGALALAASTSMWPWVAGALAASHGFLLAGSMAPRSQLLGPNRVRLREAAVRRREVALTFDDGPDPELTPRVLELLERRNAKASFFCIGEHAEAHPHLMREIVARGHSVESHSQHHSTAFACYGPWRLYRELETAQRAIADASGCWPVFFRAPFGTRNPMLDPRSRGSGSRTSPGPDAGSTTSTETRAACCADSPRGWLQETCCSCTTTFPGAIERVRRRSWRCCPGCSSSSRTAA